MADFCCRNCTELAAAIRAECDGDETTMQAVLLILEVEDFLAQLVPPTTGNNGSAQERHDDPEMNR